MIKFGIVGAGGIAQKFARDLKLVNHARLVAVSARTAEKAKNYQKAYQCEYAFNSYEAMAKSDVIDAVYIATPHNFHKVHALLFLNHGKHVLVEKPFAVNALESKEMIDAAKHNRVLIMEAMWTHFLPAVRFLMTKLSKHTYGKLLHTSINFGFYLAPRMALDSRILNPNLAGGSLLDLGIYPVSFAYLIKQSQIKNLNASATFTSTGVDRDGIIELLETNGASHILKHSMYEDLDRQAQLQFEYATIILNDFPDLQSLSINQKTYHFPFKGEGFVHEIEAFVQSILDHQINNEIMPLKRTQHVMKLMDAIRQKIGLTYPFE